MSENFDDTFNVTFSGVTGKEIARFMRRHKCTIRDLAKRIGVTMESIRKARMKGLSFLGALDYWNGITNTGSKLPPRYRAMLAIHQSL